MVLSGDDDNKKYVASRQGGVFKHLSKPAFAAIWFASGSLI